MGCFTGTCMLSQLPIQHYDPVVEVLIRSNRFEKFEFRDWSGGFVNTDDVFRPIFWPMYGKYDDYGGVEDRQYINKTLFDAAFTEKTGLTPYETLDDHKFTVGEVSYNEPVFGKCSLTRVLIHKEMWDHCLKIDLKEFFLYQRYRRVPLREAYREYISKRVLLFTEMRASKKFMFQELDDIRETILQKSSMLDWLTEGVLNEKMTLEEAFEIADHSADMFHVDAVMGLGLKKAWMPQTGQGHQDVHWNITKAFGEKIAEFSQKKIDYDPDADYVEGDDDLEDDE